MEKQMCMNGGKTKLAHRTNIVGDEENVDRTETKLGYAEEDVHYNSWLNNQLIVNIALVTIHI